LVIFDPDFFLSFELGEAPKGIDTFIHVMKMSSIMQMYKYIKDPIFSRKYPLRNKKKKGIGPFGTAEEPMTTHMPFFFGLGTRPLGP
jgi:hypothetical protein